MGFVNLSMDQCPQEKPHELAAVVNDMLKSIGGMSRGVSKL